MESDHILVHGTTLDLDGTAVLLRGPSGSGKSDLALRLIDGGAVLVSDDQTTLQIHNGQLLTSAPPTIAGLIEVRGIGLLNVVHHNNVPLKLVVELTPPEHVERLPDPEQTDYLGISVPLLRLSAFEASTPAKIRFWTRQDPEASL